MMKFNLSTAAVAFSVFAQSIFAGDITFFDASKNIGVPKGKNIVNHPDSIELTSTKQIEFKGEWDLSKNLDFEIDVENLSAARGVDIRVHIRNDEKPPLQNIAFVNRRACESARIENGFD